MPKSLNYSQLSKGSKDKLKSTLVRLHKSGLSVNDTKGMTDSQLKQALGFKGKQSSFNGLKRNIQQLQLGLTKTTRERQEKIRDYALTDFVKQKYRGKGLSRIKAQLSKGIGLNIFFDIAKKVQTSFNLNEQQSFRQTDVILRRARTNYSRLSKREREILSFFS